MAATDRSQKDFAYEIYGETGYENGQKKFSDYKNGRISVGTPTLFKYGTALGWTKEEIQWLRGEKTPNKQRQKLDYNFFIERIIFSNRFEFLAGFFVCDSDEIFRNLNYLKQDMAVAEANINGKSIQQTLYDISCSIIMLLEANGKNTDQILTLKSKVDTNLLKYSKLYISNSEYRRPLYFNEFISKNGGTNLNDGLDANLPCEIDLNYLLSFGTIMFEESLNAIKRSNLDTRLVFHHAFKFPDRLMQIIKPMLERYELRSSIQVVCLGLAAGLKNTWPEHTHFLQTQLVGIQHLLVSSIVGSYGHSVFKDKKSLLNLVESNFKNCAEFKLYKYLYQKLDFLFDQETPFIVTNDIEKISFSLDTRYLSENFLHFLFTHDVSIVDVMILKHIRKNPEILYELLDKLELFLISTEAELINFHAYKELTFRVNFLRNYLDGTIKNKTNFQYFEILSKNLAALKNTELQSIAVYQLSYSHYASGQIEKAISVAEKAIKLDSKNYKALSFLAMLNMQIDQKEVSNQLLKESKLLNNMYEFTHFYLGVLHESQGEYEEAITHYTSALLIQPNFYEAGYNLTNCLFNSGRIVDATKLIVFLTTRQKFFEAELMNSLAVSLFEAERSAAAIQLLKDTYSRTQSEATALNLGMIYLERNQVEESTLWATKAISQRNSNIKRQARKILNMIRKGSPRASLGRRVYNEEVDESSFADIDLIFSKQSVSFDTEKYVLLDKIRTVLRKQSVAPLQYEPRAVKLAKRKARALLEKQNAAARRKAELEEIRLKEENLKKVTVNTVHYEYNAHDKSGSKIKRRKIEKTFTLYRSPSYSAG